MKGTMKVAVMLGIGRMGFEERPIPEIKSNEILVKLEYVGVCGSISITMKQGELETTSFNLLLY